jgi:hypothetical protein
MTWKRENSWPYRGSNSDPLVVQPVASRYTYYVIPPHSLTIILRRMGFVWKRSQSKRLILAKHAGIVNRSSIYLEKSGGRGGRDSFCLDVSWVGNNLTFHKCWQKRDNAHGVIGIENCIENVTTCKYRLTKWDALRHRRQTNSTNTEKWLSTKVLSPINVSNVNLDMR